MNARAIASGFSGGRRGARRFGRTGRRRYSGARRSFRRGRSYKRRRTMPFGKRVKRQAVRAGMGSKKQYGSICRDLGTMFPECLSVKVYYHFQHPIQRTGSTATTFASYDCRINCYPYLPAVNLRGAATTHLTGYTAVESTSAMGWTRLVGLAAEGASAMYREALVVSMAHDLRLEFFPYQDGTVTTSPSQKQLQPMRHFYHMYDTAGAAQTAVTDQASSDLYAEQPDVKMKLTGGLNYGWPGGATVGTGQVLLPSTRVRWRGNIWPHKVQEIPLDSYIGDKANWGSKTTLPAQYATLQFSGAIAGTTAAGTTQEGPVVTGLVTGSLCFTMLLKTPLVAVT